MDYFLPILGAVLYISAAVHCWYRSVNDSAGRVIGPASGLGAIITHAFVLYRLIDGQHGQHLSSVNMLSQSVWFMACGGWILGMSRLFAPLSMAVYVLASVSMSLLVFLPQTQTPVAYSGAMIIHVLLSLMIVSIYLLSGLQALLIVLQHHMMKYNAKTWMRYQWPAIEKMEQYLFHLIAMGLIGLTSLMAYSFWVLPMSVWSQYGTKVLFVGAAWLASAVLMTGRMLWGWRGSVAVKWTWFGLILVFSAFLLASIK